MGKITRTKGGAGSRLYEHLHIYCSIYVHSLSLYIHIETETVSAKMAANFNFKLLILLLLMSLNSVICFVELYKITFEQPYHLKTQDLVKFSNELRSFERLYYISIRWSFNRVMVQSNQMLKTPLVRVDKHGLVTLELPRKLFWIALTTHMDVQSNPGPCSIENCSKFSCLMSSLRNVNTVCDHRPKYSRRELFGLKSKYHVPEHLYYLLKCEGILKTRRNRAGVSVKTNLRANVSKYQTNSKIYGNTQKIDFAHTFMFCCILYPHYRGVVYLSKHDFVFKKYSF